MVFVTKPLILLYIPLLLVDMLERLVKRVFSVGLPALYPYYHLKLHKNCTEALEGHFDLLLITYYLLLITYYLLLTTYYLSLITYYLLLITYYLYLLLIISFITPITTGSSIVHSLS